MLIWWFSFDFCFRMDFVGGGGWDFGDFEGDLLGIESFWGIDALFVYWIV